jgi:hypothetical protein
MKEGELRKTQKRFGEKSMFWSENNVRKIGAAAKNFEA